MKGVPDMFRSMFRLLAIELCNFLFANKYSLFCIGCCNRLFPLIGSVFVAYPSRAEYTNYYRFASRQKDIWQPCLSGFFIQEGKMIVLFVITATEDFFTKEYTKEMINLVGRVNNIQKTIGASHRTFAGVLPGRLFMQRIIREAKEAELTAVVVTQAIIEQTQKRGLTEVIVLGGLGFIGKRVVQRLQHMKHLSVTSVDTGSIEHTRIILLERKTTPSLLVNVSVPGVLEELISVLWPGVTVLNEVYPGLTDGAVERLTTSGVEYIHLAGVRAFSFPHFPFEYKGAIPCCAAMRVESDTYDIVYH